MGHNGQVAALKPLNISKEFNGFGVEKRSYETTVDAGHFHDNTVHGNASRW
ncbi:hypothetical protein FACS1894184_14410 [Clostridia bacterium]|nr:hypothetical protein FACS1894184_14410 [Clostridia bacterium]